jgi:hypothetical protein
MRRVLLLFLLFAPARAWGAGEFAQLEAGGAFTLGMATADHSKLWGRFSVSVFESWSWSPWIAGDLALGTRRPVNPGATPTATAPDLRESSSGSQAAIFRLLLKSPMRVGGGSGRVVAGLTWYFADLAGPYAASIPNAPTLGVSWARGGAGGQSGGWAIDGYTGLSFNPLDSGALLLYPELGARRMLAGPVGFRFSARLPIVQTLSGGTTIIQPAVTGAIVSFF